MTQSTRILKWMAGFILGVFILAALVFQRLVEIFAANPFFNVIILIVLAAGIITNLRQIFSLAHEAKWIDSFRKQRPANLIKRQPRLLAPMAQMLSGRDSGPSSLSAPSVRTILDGLQLRLEESRDLSRYLIGVAIFLGLLGTFWGLLVTIRSVTDIIGSLSIGTDAVLMFSALKENIRVPLGGMATSFSTSLFGLSSSLIIGFLDLQAGHAQNRFYNELEEWLSGMINMAPAGAADSTNVPVPAYVQALLEQTADGLNRMQRAIADNERERRASNDQLADLTTQIQKLSDILARDVREREAAASNQDDLKTLLRQLSQQTTGGNQMSEELRSEFRLLARTIAAGMESQRQSSESPR